LLLLSVMSAAVVVLASPSITTRFALAFLGLLSSLVPYLHGEHLAGLVLVLSSGVLLPSVLARRFDKVERTTREIGGFQLSTVALHMAAALTIGILVQLQPRETALAVLASVGLAAFSVRESSLKTVLGLIVMSQVALVMISLRSPPLWIVLSIELCRILSVLSVFSSGQRD